MKVSSPTRIIQHITVLTGTPGLTSRSRSLSRKKKMDKPEERASGAMCTSGEEASTTSWLSMSSQETRYCLASFSAWICSLVALRNASNLYNFQVKQNSFQSSLDALEIIPYMMQFTANVIWIKPNALGKLKQFVVQVKHSVTFFGNFWSICPKSEHTILNFTSFCSSKKKTMVKTCSQAGQGINFFVLNEKIAPCTR